MFSDKQKLREFIAMRLARKESYMEELSVPKGKYVLEYKDLNKAYIN